MLVMPAAKPRNFRGSARRLLGALRPEAPLVALVVLLAVVGVSFAIAGPRILGDATNIVFNGLVGKQLPAGITKEQAVEGLRDRGEDQLADMLAGMDVVAGEGVDFDALRRTLIVLVAVYVLAGAFGWSQGYLMAGVTQRTAYRMRLSVEEKLGRLPLSYFDRHPRGDILSRVTNDIDNIAQTLQQGLTQLITGLLTVIGVLIMMFTISPILAVISVLMVPLSVVVTVLIAGRSQKQFAAQWDETGKLNGHVEEMHTGHAIVKVFGRQPQAIAAFDAYNDRLFAASFKAQFISGIIQPALNFLGNLNYVAIAVIGGVRVASGRLSLGDVQAFIQYSRQFTMPIVQTASIMNVLQSAVASAERVFELLDEAEEVPDVATPERLRDVAGRVELHGVSFRYEPEAPLIEDLDLVVEPGQTVAIVGPTGAGKTTLVNLLMRFYEIDAGRIAIDGVDTRRMTRDDLRRLFGMVLQDAWLFHGTIRQNITYGVDSATDEQVLRAARAAHVDHFVRTLPDGYDTVLDDEAANISQGERQLLTIARAFLVDPPMLILDEATSSVDTRTEVLIQRAMARLMKGRTSFVIAHRLSTIRDADTILVMDHGRIVEQGTHAELIARRGFYADLYTSQFEEPTTNGAGPHAGHGGAGKGPGTGAGPSMVATGPGPGAGPSMVGPGPGTGPSLVGTGPGTGGAATGPEAPGETAAAAASEAAPAETAAPVDEPTARETVGPASAAAASVAARGVVGPGSAVGHAGRALTAAGTRRGPRVFGWRAVVGAALASAAVSIAGTVGVLAALHGGLRELLRDDGEPASRGAPTTRFRHSLSEKAVNESMPDVRWLGPPAAPTAGAEPTSAAGPRSRPTAPAVRSAGQQKRLGR